MVREKGLEPSLVAELVPKTSVSTIPPLLLISNFIMFLGILSISVFLILSIYVFLAYFLNFNLID